jgi:hypothetical protein
MAFVDALQLWGRRQLEEIWPEMINLHPGNVEVITEVRGAFTATDTLKLFLHVSVTGGRRERSFDITNDEISSWVLDVAARQTEEEQHG